MTTYIFPPLDSSPSDIYLQFVTAMQAFIPGWQPQSGNLDDWMGQAFAAIIAQLTEISSDVATAIYRYFGAFIANLPPIGAAPSQGLVNITATDTTGYTIPAGTDIIFTDSSGNTHGFSTVATATISPGASAVNSVAVTADVAGTAGNGVSGNFSQLSTPLAFIQNITLQAPTNGGADAEDDDAYLIRLRTLYTTLTPKPVVASDFSTLALQQTGVGRAVTVDGFDPANWTLTGNVTTSSVSATNVSSISVSAIPVGAPVTGANIPVGTFVTATVPASGAFVMSQAATASATGENITIGGSLRNGGKVGTWVADSGGNALTTAVMSSVQSALAALCLATIIVNVLAPTYTTINVAATVFAWPGQNTATIQAAVQAAIQNYISQATWGIPPAGQATAGGQAWLNDNVVRYANLEHVILGVAGVHYVGSLTINGGTADLPIPGVVALPKMGTLTVTVNLG